MSPCLFRKDTRYFNAIDHSVSSVVHTGVKNRNNCNVCFIAMPSSVMFKMNITVVAIVYDTCRAVHMA